MERFPDLFAVKSVVNECEMVYIFICPTCCELFVYVIAEITLNLIIDHFYIPPGGATK